MKKIIITLTIFLSASLCYSQTNVLKLHEGKTYNQKIFKGETKRYKINLHKDDFCYITVMQINIDVMIDIFNPSLKKIYTYDTPNGNHGPEEVNFKADTSGTYYFDIYPLNDFTGMTDSMKNSYVEKNQGDYEIGSISILAKKENSMVGIVDDLNLGFEKTSGKNLPENWNLRFEGTNITLDSIVKNSGRASLLLSKEFLNSSALAYDSIPIVFKGSVIELRGFLKTQNVSEGYCGMEMLFFDSNGFVEYPLYNKKITLQGTNDWKQYSLTFPLPEDVKAIYIITFLDGTGKMWVDDLQISINGKDIVAAKYIEPKKYKADLDNEFDKGSNITSINLTESTLNNLDVLGKVWGFLKYYHPAVANGEHNWDYELFRITPKIVAANNQEERNKVLFDWIKGLGKINTTKINSVVTTEARQLPDLSWIDASILGEELTLQLNEIKDAERENESYYIGLFPARNPKFKNERRYKKMNFSDAGLRLLSLFRYWNIIQYYCPNKYLIGENWNDVLKEFIPKFLNVSSELQYNLAVLTLICRIHDSHAYIAKYSNDSLMWNYFGNNRAPFRIKFIEDKAVVTDYYSETLGLETGIKIGDVIETINDKPVDEIVKESLPLTSASNYPTMLAVISQYLLRTRESSLNVSYRHGDLINTTQVKCFSGDEMHLSEYYNKKVDTCFKLITPEIAYIYPGSIRNSYLPEIMEAVQNTKGLIIDQRCYPMERIDYTLSEYLMPQPIGVCKASFCSITTPGLFTIGGTANYGIKNNKYYNGKVVILINEQTQSQAESNAMAFRKAPGAVVIGSTTAGADGDISEIFLPGGMKTYITGIGIYLADGREMQRVGIIPDIEIKPTIKGISEGRDELLEKAIEIINEEQ